MDPASFSRKAQEKKNVILDIRSYEAFGGQHIAGSYHIDFGGNFATFAGWVLPPECNILLVAENAEQAEEAAVWLRSVLDWIGSLVFSTEECMNGRKRDFRRSMSPSSLRRISIRGLQVVQRSPSLM